MVNRANVNRLVAAAWSGMEDALAQENASAEDVINATLAIAAGGIQCACSEAAGDARVANRVKCRATLQELLLLTVDETVCH